MPCSKKGGNLTREFTIREKAKIKLPLEDDLFYEMRFLMGKYVQIQSKVQGKAVLGGR